MARWRREAGDRIEGPAWYRTFDPAMWDEPDVQEQRMIDGCPGWRPWPDDVHEWHARRRWHEAQYRYRQEHPALAEQELEDLIGEEAQARRRERFS